MKFVRANGARGRGKTKTMGQPSPLSLDSEDSYGEGGGQAGSGNLMGARKRKGMEMLNFLWGRGKKLLLYMTEKTKPSWLRPEKMEGILLKNFPLFMPGGKVAH